MLLGTKCLVIINGVPQYAEVASIFESSMTVYVNEEAHFLNNHEVIHTITLEAFNAIREHIMRQNEGEI